MIQLTERAAQEIAAILQADAQGAEKGLRIFVDKGGCSGLQYNMEINQRQAGDEEIQQWGARLFIDAPSAQYLKGAIIDYSDSLTTTGFRIHNPNAKQTCGCGTSFEAN